MLDIMPLILAQAGEDLPPVNPEAQQSIAPPPGDPNANLPPRDSGGGFGEMGMLLVLVLVLVVMSVFSILAGRREKKRRAQMLESVKKNVRVQTVGGIIGTVTDLRDNEVTLKVDESSNTRIRFARSAIQSVLEEEKS